jgi:hypothetical protein
MNMKGYDKNDYDLFGQSACLCHAKHVLVLYLRKFYPLGCCAPYWMKFSAGLYSVFE